MTGPRAGAPSGSVGKVAAAAKPSRQQPAAIEVAARGVAVVRVRGAIAGSQSAIVQAGSTATRPGRSSARASAEARMGAGGFIANTRYAWWVGLSAPPLEGRLARVGGT